MNEGVYPTSSRGPSLAALWLCGMALGASFRPAVAAPISSFRLTGVEGKIGLEYEYDKQNASTSGVVSTDRVQDSFTEEVEILTHSYIYHPNLLKLDAGVGISLLQDKSVSSGLETSSKQELTKLNFRASVLEKKPYPMVLFYGQDYSTKNPLLGERLVQEDTRYGFGLRLLEPFLPVSMSLDVYSTQQQGRSSDQVVDFVQDVVAVTVRKNYTNEDYISGSYNWSQQASASGAVPLAITPTTTTDNKVSIDTGNVFGANGQFTLTTTTNFETQQGPSPREAYSFTPDLRWRYSDNLESYYRLSLTNASQEDIDTSRYQAQSGITYRYDRNLTTSGTLEWLQSKATGTEDSNLSAAGQLSYQTEYGPLGLGIGANLSYALNDRVSSSPTAAVIGESVVLVGLSPVSLLNPYVVTSTVMVSNAGRTQSFLEGTDYLLITVGSQTTIERLATGNIQDGEEVLVEYEYETGGTFGTADLGAGFSVNATFYKYYSAFLNYQRQDISLRSGFSTLPLNETQNVRYGAAISNYPLPLRAKGSARVQISHRREEVSPADSMDVDLSLVAPFGRRTQVYVSARKSYVDNLNSPEDSDIIAFRFAVRSRAASRLNVTLELDNERDTGGSIPRESWNGLLKADWRLYRLQVGSVASYAREKQGDYEQDGFNFKLTVRREF